MRSRIEIAEAVSTPLFLARRLSAGLAILMVVQAVSGIAFRGAYRDVEWIRWTWFGNDWVTLLLATPLLLLGLRRAGDSVRGRLLWLGILGYGAYNYAYYVLGATLNPFFLLYVLAVIAAAVALILGLVGTDPEAIAGSFSTRTPARALGGFYVAVAGGLALIWIAFWAGYVFAGRRLPVEPEAFRLVAALDLILMVPALAGGGLLLWSRRSWGYVIAAVAGVQASLYLTVLLVNSSIAVLRGTVDGPGEIPIWGTLGLAVGVATLKLLREAAPTDGATPRSGLALLS